MPKRKKPTYFRPRNWEKFQHYKGRRPPWIKVHNQLLRDHDFNDLTELQQLHLMKIWLLYSDIGKPLPWDCSYIAAQLQANYRTIGKTLRSLISSNFIELCPKDASTALACPIIETETETETETEKKDAEPTGSDSKLSDLNFIIFSEGKSILGKSAGGVIRKLIDKVGDVEALKVIRLAADKKIPMEYVQASLRRGKPSPRHEMAI